MRTKEFEVPTDFITEFAEALAEHELTNEINGVTEEGDILIEVSYEKNERANVFALSELLDDYIESEEESEETDNQALEYGIFILNVQVFVAIVIVIKTIAEFATTFEKECRTSIKARKIKIKNCENERDEMEIIESKKHEGLSVAKIKGMKNYENVSDEQAQEILFAVKNLAVIFYEHLNNKKKEQEYSKAA